MVKNKKKGFTIVELVIVIAVIGILSAVLIPVFSNVVSSANNAKQQYELSQAYTDYVQHADTEELKSQEQVYLVKLGANDAVIEAWERASSESKDAWVDAKVAFNALETKVLAKVQDDFTETYNGYKVYVKVSA